MLSALVKEHQAKQSVSQVREICEANRKDALAATETYVNVATNTVNEEVAQVYAAQKKLEKEVKGLQTNTAHFGKQTMQWLDMIREFNGSLTDVGDFQNWAKTVEWDMKYIASALDYVAQSDGSNAADFPAAAAGDAI